jgi:hypothetical protein
MFGLLLGLTACESKPEEPAVEPAIEPTPAPAVPQPAAEPVDEPGGDAAEFASMKDADWCPAAHADTMKIVSAMEAAMKKAGVDAGPDDYEPPPEPRYVELCGKLPLEMQKCLVVGWAARNRDDCQTSLDGLDADAKSAYAELMGK